MALSADQKRQIVNTVVDCFKGSRHHFQPYYDLCRVLQQLYNVELPDQIRHDLSEEHPGLVPPELYRNVDDLLANIDAFVFGTDPFFQLKARGRTSDFNVRCGMSYLDWATDQSDLQTAYDKSILSAIKFAVGVGFVEIDEIQPTVLDRNVPVPLDETGKQSRLTHTTFRKGKTVYCGKYTPIPLFRYFPDFMLPRPRWAVHQCAVSFLDLLEGLEQKRYKFKEEDLRKVKDDFPRADWGTSGSEPQFTSTVMKEYNFPVELLHFRGWIPILNSKNRLEKPKWIDAIITVANRKLLIQCEENEWHFPAAESFIMTYLFPSDEETLYPVGKLEASMDEFLYLFYLRNQRLMNLEFLLNPSWITDSKELPDYLPAERGKVYKATDGRRFDPVPQPDITGKAYIEADIHTDQIRWIFHSNEYSAGIDPRRTETATGIAVLKGATDKLRRFENRTIVNTGLKKVLRRYLEIGQLYHEKMPLKLFDSNEITLIGKDEIFGEMEIAVDTVEAFERPLQRQEMHKVVELYKDDRHVDAVELRRRHLRLMEFRDVEKLVPDSKDRLLPIEKENMIMVQSGKVFPVLPEEPHDLHYKVHQPWQSVPAVAAHMEIHLRYFQEQQKGPKEAKSPGFEREQDLVASMSQKLQPKNLIAG